MAYSNGSSPPRSLTHVRNFETLGPVQPSQKQIVHKIQKALRVGRKHSRKNETNPKSISKRYVPNTKSSKTTATTTTTTTTSFVCISPNHPLFLISSSTCLDGGMEVSNARLDAGATGGCARTKLGPFGPKAIGLITALGCQHEVLLFLAGLFVVSFIWQGFPRDY